MEVEEEAVVVEAVAVKVEEAVVEAAVEAPVALEVAVEEVVEEEVVVEPGEAVEADSSIHPDHLR